MRAITALEIMAAEMNKLTMYLLSMVVVVVFVVVVVVVVVVLVVVVGMFPAVKVPSDLSKET